MAQAPHRDPALLALVGVLQRQRAAADAAYVAAVRDAHAAGWSMAELAAAAGVAKSTIHRTMRGPAGPGPGDAR